MIDERFLGSLTATVPIYGIVDPISHEIDDFNAELWIKLSNVTKISRQSNGNDELFVMCVRPERINTKNLAEDEECYPSYVTNEFTYDLVREILG